MFDSSENIFIREAMFESLMLKGTVVDSVKNIFIREAMFSALNISCLKAQLLILLKTLSLASIQAVAASVSVQL